MSVGPTRRAGPRPSGCAGTRPRTRARVLAAPGVSLAVALAVLLGGTLPTAAHAEERWPADAQAIRAAALSTVLGSRLAGADAGGSTGPTAGQPRTWWGWPLLGTPTIVGAYDPPARRWLPGHRGIDLAGVRGEPVLAVEAGVVSFSGEVAGVGVLSVTHADGLRSTYQPVVDRVGRGARVARGEEIGVLDLGGHCVLHDCLHLGARRGDAYVDPTPLLLGLELTLLPVGG